MQCLLFDKKSLCTDCVYRYICGSSDFCSQPWLYNKVCCVHSDDINCVVVECELFDKDVSYYGKS